MDEATPRSSRSFRSESLGSMTTKTVMIELEVTLDQGQRAFADRSEANHHDRASNAPVLRPMGHQISFKETSVSERG